MLQKVSTHALVAGLMLIGLVCFFTGTSALAQQSDFLDDAFYEEDLREAQINDPFEQVNRAFFRFNDFTYTWIFDPLATGYSHLVPLDIRLLISNFFYNLQEPMRSINALLQGRFDDAGALLARFTLNTTCGVAGLGDPAGRDFHLAPIRATMGETLGTWGIGDGAYLVVPFIGPSTVRDFSGSLIDGLGTPYYAVAEGWQETALIHTVKETNSLTFHLNQYEEFKKLSFDPYVAMRNGYLQYRRKSRPVERGEEEGAEKTP